MVKKKKVKKTKNKKWIQKAIKKPGALTNWFKRNRKKLKRILGYDPITKKGDIRDSAVNKILKLHKEGRIRLRTVTVRRLNLARTLRKVRPRR